MLKNAFTPISLIGRSLCKLPSPKYPIGSKEAILIDVLS